MCTHACARSLTRQCVCPVHLRLYYLLAPSCLRADEAYDVMSGCPFHDQRLNAIARAHGMSAAQVCFRWTLQRGAIIATGTGHNATKAVLHAHDDLGTYDPTFELADEEMAYLDGIRPQRV